MTFWTQTHSADSLDFPEILIHASLPNALNTEKRQKGKRISSVLCVTDN